MSSTPPPLLGFNNNVRHRGRIFHIQTEDSGVKSPRVVTHLFADGGRIIKTTRTEYTEHVARPDMQAYVRNLMKEQHKGMFTALRLGQLDPMLENVCGPFEQPVQSKAPPPVVLSSPPASEAFPEPLVSDSFRGSDPRLQAAAPASSLSEEGRSSEAEGGRKRALSNPNLRKLTPSVPPPGMAAFELDVAALERLPPRPPPPPQRAERAPEPSSARPLRKSNPDPAARKPQPGGKNPPPSLSRPSARFASAPSKTAQSIFGDGVISEQSLDEVILSYLAEDLDGSSE